MIAGLEEIDSALAHEVDNAVLLGQPPRPGAGELIPQRFGLAGAGEGVTQNRLDDFEGPQR